MIICILSHSYFLQIKTTLPKRRREVSTTRKLMKFTRLRNHGYYKIDKALPEVGDAAVSKERETTRELPSSWPGRQLHWYSFHEFSSMLWWLWVAFQSPMLLLNNPNKFTGPPNYTWVELLFLSDICALCGWWELCLHA